MPVMPVVANVGKGVPEVRELIVKQARNAGLPTHAELIRVILHRLQEFPGDGGLGNVAPVILPVEEKESAQCKCC